MIYRRRWVEGVFWAVTLAVAAYLIVACWYLLGQAVLKPLLGPGLGFALAAFLSGAAWGAFAALACVVFPER